MQDVTNEELARMIKVGFDTVHNEMVGLKADFEEKMAAGFEGIHRRMDDLADKVGNHEERLVKLEEKVLQ